MSRAVLPGAVRVALFALVAVSTGCGGNPTGSAEIQRRDADSGPPPEATLVVAQEGARHLAFVDPRRGVVDRVEVGASPWGVAVGSGGRIFASTAEGVAVVDGRRRRLVRRVPYRTPVGPPGEGEYRAGGMGIAVSPDGRSVFVGVHPARGGRGRLEVLDVVTSRVVAAYRIGERPFDVLVAPGGREVYSVDHDSYGITAIDLRSRRSRTLPVAPLGRGAFDKLNYGAVDRRGRLLLPVQGRVLAVLDPGSGRYTRRPLRARVHQAGAALTRDGRLLTVGAEGLGSGDRGPSLSVFDLATGRERIIPLGRPHEDVAVDPSGRWAFVSGGYTRGGWDGISVVDLRRGTVRGVRVPERPLGIAVLPRSP